MIKRAISIGFLLLANIVLLAHAVVPHHHHNGLVISFLQNSCSQEESQQNPHHTHSYHNPCNAPSEHKNDSDTEICILNSVYTRIKSNDEQKAYYSFHAGRDSHQSHQILGDLPPIQPFTPGLDAGFSLKQKPFTVTYQTCISFNYVGLRAPPVC